jgi:hypothetical protein
MRDDWQAIVDSKPTPAKQSPAREPVSMALLDRIQTVE